MPVVDPVLRFVRGAPPRVRLGVRLALAALEWSTFPRRFSSLPPLVRAERLRRFEDGRRGLLRDLVLLVKTLVSLGYARDRRVQEAIGIPEPSCRRAAPAVARPAALGDLSPAGEVERCDVVVVGSGAGGAAAARVLAERGLDVIVLEEGGHHDAASYPRDPFEAFRALYRDSGLTLAEGRPAIPLPMGRCVGGTTVINSGTCLRPPPDVLAGWRDERGIPWATDLEAEFERLERDLDVRPVAVPGRNGELCRDGAEALGLRHGALPRNAGDVVCCGSCPTGCALDAKTAMHVSELPRAVAAGTRLRANRRVLKLLTRGGRVTGVLAEGPYAVEARAVVLAAGAVGTPELLLRQGLGNREVGRHLHIHPACWVGARHADPVRGWDGVMQSWEVTEWRDDRGLFLEATFTPFAFGAHWLRGAGSEFKERMERYGDLAIIGVHYSEQSAEGRVRVDRAGRARVTYRLPPGEAAAIRFGIARAADIHFAAGALEVYPQVGAVGALRPGEQQGIEDGRFRPADLRLEAFHPMGSARMGADPATSAVDPSGALRGVEGVWIADASLLPTSLRVNPMLTIMACARQVATQLATHLGAGS